MQIVVMFLVRIKSGALILAPHKAHLILIELRNSGQEIMRVYAPPNLAAHFEVQVWAG